MARPERNDVDYFPHEVGSGKKMYYIETKYGNDGYATRYKILEELGRAEHHHINLSKFENVMYLSAKCNIDEEKLLMIIGDLTKMGVFDQELMDHNILWCQKFVDSIQDAYTSRKNDCISRDSLLQQIQNKGGQKPSLCSTETQQSVKNDDKNPQSIVDYTIVENKKEEKEDDETSSSIVSKKDPDKNLPDISGPDQEEIDRRKKVAKRNQKLVDGVKDILHEHGMAYKPDRKFEKYRANLFFRSDEFGKLADKYKTTPGKLALMLCRGAMEHDFWRGKITNTVNLYDHRAKIHNDCVASFKKKKDRRQGL